MTDLVNVLLLVSIMCLLFGVGLGTPFQSVAATAARYRLVLRGLAANFVIIPALFALALRALSVDVDIAIGLLIMAAVPVAPLAPPFVGIVRGDVAYSVGLMLIASFLGLPLTPLILHFALPPSEAGLQIDTPRILQTLLTAQLLPLSAGMAIQHFRAQWAGTLLRFVPTLGRVGVVATLIVITATRAEQILGLGARALGLSFALIVLCLAVGDAMMIGLSRELRRSLAVSTAIRNAALGLLIVGTNFPDSPALALVFCFGCLSLGASVAYGKLGRGTETPNAPT